MVADLEELLLYVNIHNEVQGYGHPRKLYNKQNTLIHSNTNIAYPDIVRVTK